MANFNQQSQNVDKQYNSGKDQFIQNIVLVGQFLDFAKIEGLIPKPTSHLDFNSVINAFEQTFNERLGSDLAYATATTGEILKETILKWTPKDSSSALPLKAIMRTIPTDLYRNLSKRNYWDAFFEPINYAALQAIRLYSLEILWTKHFKTRFMFKIVKGNSDGSATYLGIETESNNSPLNIDALTYEQFRVLIAGIVIDLIRLSSIASTDVNFWKSIANLLEIRKT